MTAVEHPLTHYFYPLVMSARQAGESVGLGEEAIVRLCKDDPTICEPHEPFGRWRIYTIHLWRKFGLPV